MSARTGFGPAPGGLRSPGAAHGGADVAGDRLSTLPVLLHVLWLQELSAEDLAAELLEPRTIVYLADGVGR
ncbi:DNA-binding transcriptional ArsR family regulator [Streptomyces sp. B4I13]|uniref:hypothetical protein n=1 Tax=Streptomyces sp. B4I13 TaxID=3042271 RepID=UPI0027861124|nr:hypothetical protein [Streptomyces sp. B4I13]MDQ0956210.1 DNA-binding transcriptional ArsR family regulator [Streptomyces sp. B4I13]